MIAIDELCDNILLEVFSHLNAVDLKNAVLVAKRWNDLIGSSASTMRKFRFRIENKRHSNRNHLNYAIHTSETTEWTTIGGNICPSSVRSLHIVGNRYYDIISSDEVLTFLSRLTELEELSFENVRLNDGTDEIDEKIELPRLKTLRIMGDDFMILRHIEAKELQHLHCIGRCNRQIDGFESIAQSIVQFSQVQSLILWNCMEAFEHIDVQQVKCRLNSFEVYHINVSPINVAAFEVNLRQFLLSQTGNISHLKFDCSMFDMDDGRKIVKDFLQISFNECTSLTSLDIRNLSVPRDGHFYQSLSPNNSIRYLQVHWGFDGEVMEGLLKNCPKLTRLEADMCHLSGDGLSTIASFCPELMHLGTFKLTGCIETDAIFEHLKYLSISKMERTAEPLLKLMGRCPKLEQIRIDECGSDTELLMDASIWPPTMKKLTIAGKRYEMLERIHFI